MPELSCTLFSSHHLAISGSRYRAASSHSSTHGLMLMPFSLSRRPVCGSWWKAAYCVILSTQSNSAKRSSGNSLGRGSKIDVRGVMFIQGGGTGVPRKFVSFIIVLFQDLKQFCLIEVRIVSREGQSGQSTAQTIQPQSPSSYSKGRQD